jgi:hypothetical protein
MKKAVQTRAGKALQEKTGLAASELVAQPRQELAAGHVVHDHAVACARHVTAAARVAFWCSADGLRYTQLGTPFDATMGRWVSAQIGLFATGASGSFADLDYLRVTP